MSRCNYGRWAVFSCPRPITGRERQRDRGEREGRREGGGEMGDERERERERERRVLNTICGAFDAMSSCGNGRREEREDGRSPGKKVPLSLLLPIPTTPADKLPANEPR